MAETRFIAGDMREVTWSEKRDAGEVFPAEVGTWRNPDGRFQAYVMSGWSGGVRSKLHPDQESARQDVDRIWDQFYG
jgi:hypothetical protein